jgi:opacity protein-like surface antigen
MFKSIVSTTAFALALGVPAVAGAEPSNGGSAGGSCPPGSWFCAEAPQQQPSPAGQPVQPLQPLPSPDDEAPPTKSGPIPPPPPVVVYQPPPPTVVVRPETPAPYEYEPPPRHPLGRAQEWGLNLHLEAAAFGRGNGDAGMGGAGLGLRFKPSRYFGIETDVDFLGGTDYLGDHRNETALKFDALVFLNPHSPVQVYLLAGFGWSGAHVTCDPNTMNCAGPLDTHYSYFGGELGGGLEFRLSHHFALDIDARGFIRGRTDDLAQAQPEFVDANGRTTNTSGGALFTGGMNIYF